MARPVLKWAGGKRQIILDIVARLPREFNGYLEPFFGGGALFFNICNRLSGHDVILSDINVDLVHLYLDIRDRPLSLLQELSEMNFGNRKEDYYAARDEFNSGEVSPLRRSALFIYLNRHCFNGLYRVNSRGKFNVPFGRYSNPRLPDEKSIIEASRCLNGSRIIQGDFQDILNYAKYGDFVYVDPPYLPISSSSNFTAYSTDGFSYSDHLRLLEALRKIDHRGVKFLLSNSGSPVIAEIYSRFLVTEVRAARNINSKKESRGKITEFLIQNY